MNEEAVVKLAQLEGKLEAVSETVSRIERVMERAVDRFEASDGAVRELIVQNQHNQERLGELRRATELCHESHRAATDSLSQRVSSVHDKVGALENKSTGGLKVIVWFCGLFSAIMVGAGGWAFSQISANTQINALQQQRIERMEKEIGDVQAARQK